MVSLQRRTKSISSKTFLALRHITLALAVNIIATSVVYAQNNTSGGNAIQINNPLQVNSIAELASSIASFIFYLGLVLVPLLVLIGAFYIMTSGGSQQRVSTGKKFILYAAIGFAIVLFARGIVGIIRGVLGVG